MPNLDKTGPEGKGPKTGRGLGKGSNLPKEELLKKLGKGLGKRRHGDCREELGQGKRTNYYKSKK
jgi:hypothetical protein